MPIERILEDAQAIQMVFQRLYLANDRITLAYQEQRGSFQILAIENGQLSMALDRPEFEAWKLAPGEKIAVNLEDRGFRYDAVAQCQGLSEVDNMPCTLVTLPRVLRRSDSHRLTDFAPEATPVCTFSNSRNSLLEAQVKGFGLEGLELTLRDPRQKIEDALRMGEESTVEVPLEADLHLMAPARVAYFGDTYVGLKFTEKTDKTLLSQYQTWLERQQQIQIQRDRESFAEGAGRRPIRSSKGPDLPQVHLWVDRDPMILVLTEKEEFARRMSEGLGRKFGVLSLDYIKGKVRPFLSHYQGDDENWGRTRVIVVHNRLRLVSPLELIRQIVEQEKCPLPVLMAGTDEDMDLKRNRAVAAGAVDYFPVEPFKILSVLRTMDETIKLFS